MCVCRLGLNIGSKLYLTNHTCPVELMVSNVLSWEIPSGYNDFDGEFLQKISLTNSFRIFCIKIAPTEKLRNGV